MTTSLTKPLYTARATATGGRAGHAVSDDGILDVDLRPPKEMGGPGGATNPEQLFAVGYAACFQSALGVVGRRQGTDTGNSTVEADVTIGTIPGGGCCVVNCTNNAGDVYAFHTGGANALRGDGSVFFMHDSIAPAVLAALISAKGGEVLPDY